jgi:vacuolar-type H+-ATPase subunit H
MQKATWQVNPNAENEIAALTKAEDERLAIEMIGTFEEIAGRVLKEARRQASREAHRIETEIDDRYGDGLLQVKMDGESKKRFIDFKVREAMTRFVSRIHDLAKIDGSPQ